jgi:hypothetical protein
MRGSLSACVDGGGHDGLCRTSKRYGSFAHATEIKVRAERRAGEMLAEMADRGERAVQKKYEVAGVSKSQSSRWQRLAKMPTEEFEAKVERATKKTVSAIDGTAKLERAELRAADNGNYRGIGYISRLSGQGIEIYRGGAPGWR